MSRDRDRDDFDPELLRRTQVLPPRESWIPPGDVRPDIDEPPPTLEAALQLWRAIKRNFSPGPSAREALAKECLAALGIEAARHSLRIQAIASRLRGEK